MRLEKNESKNYVNVETNKHIGKYIYLDNLKKYWYSDINDNIIKKDTYYIRSNNLYWL